jgi:hypothetical protein
VFGYASLRLAGILIRNIGGISGLGSLIEISGLSVCVGSALLGENTELDIWRRDSFVGITTGYGL